MELIDYAIKWSYQKQVNDLILISQRWINVL